VPAEYIWLWAMGFPALCLWELVKEFFLEDDR
jgi:hypothetical protein